MSETFAAVHNVSFVAGATKSAEQFFDKIKAGAQQVVDAARPMVDAASDLTSAVSSSFDRLRDSLGARKGAALARLDGLMEKMPDPLEAAKHVASSLKGVVTGGHDESHAAAQPVPGAAKTRILS